jgi:hypothetical protein
MTEAIERPSSVSGADTTHSFRYNGFISYSHALDGDLAPAVQRSLKRFAKPWYKARALAIFRDNESLSASPHLWTSIQEALDNSEFFILLASPTAAQSGWVAREAERWSSTKPAENVLIALTGGDLVWDGTRNDFDWDLTDALPPTLQGVFIEEPRFVDLRWAHNADHLSLNHPKFREAIADLAAPLHHQGKEEIASEEVRQHNRTIRMAWTAVALLVFLTVAAVVGGIFAVVSRNTAIAERNTVESKALAGEAITLLGSSETANIGAQVAVEAYNVAPTIDARLAITLALEQTPHFLGINQPVLDGGIVGVPDDSHNPTVVQYGDGYLTRLNGATLSRMGSPVLTRASNTATVTLDNSGTHAAISDGPTNNGYLGTWDLRTGDSLVANLPSYNSGASGLSYSPDGTRLADVTSSGNINIYNPDTGHLYDRLVAPASYEGVAYGLSDATLYTGDVNGDVWRLTGSRFGTRKLLATEEGASLAGLALSPNGKLLVFQDLNGATRLLNLDTRQTRLLSTGVPFGVLSFSANSRYVSSQVTANTSAELTGIWDTRTGQQVGEIAGFGVFISNPKYGFITTAELQHQGSFGVIPSWVWEDSTGTLKANVCAHVIGKHLSPVQWTAYLSGEPFRNVCSS